jgi:hypothetical protein
MQTKKIFLASSSELEEDRKEFEIFINRKNKDWVDKGVFLKLVIWEDFLDAMSQTRLQDEYNKAVRESDLFVMLFCTKVGEYTEEEFKTAFGQFQASNRPFILTYFKDAQISTGTANEQNLISLWAFQRKLRDLGHFQTLYKNIDQLKLHFGQQLDELATRGFIEFEPDQVAAAPANVTYQATLSGSGAIAQGGGDALGKRAVKVGGSNFGNINAGTQIETGGGAFVGRDVNTQGGDFVGRDQTSQGFSPRDLETLFAPLIIAVINQAPTDKQVDAIQQVEELKAEVTKGDQAEDSRIGRIVDGLVTMVPGAVGAIVGMFATPILSGIAGPVTKYVLDKFKGA